jgi:hypothetical protein
MRRHLYLLLLVPLLFGGNAAAAGLVAADGLTAVPGHFVSIPVAVTAGNEITVEAPPYLRLLSAPRIRDGNALVNLLAERDAPAGETQLTLQLREDGKLLAQVPVRILIARRVSFELLIPDGQVAVAGEPLTYVIVVTNTGNSADRYSFEVSSGLQYSLSPASLELAAGQRGEVRLTLDPRGQGLDTLILRASSELDPDVQHSRVLTTSILPFAGAAELDGPALAYQLTAAASWGSGGFGHALGVSLAGDLSEYVQLGSNLEYRADRLSGSLTLSGEDWGVAYRGFAHLQSLEARHGRIRGFLNVPLASSGFTAGVSYTQDPLTVSLTHTSAAVHSDAFRVTYAFDPGPAIRLTPSVGLRGYGQYGSDYRVGALLGLGIRLQTEALHAAGQFSITLPQEPTAPWSLSLTASNRVQTKFGLTGQFSVNARHLHAGVSAREILTREVTLSQGVRYVVTFGHPAVISSNIGITYRPAASQLRLHGSLVARWRDGEPAALGFGAGASYNPGSWELEVAVEELEGFHVKAGAAYRFEAFEIRSVFAHGPHSRPLLLGAGGRTGALQAALLVGYDFLSESIAAELDLQHQFSANFGAFTSLAYDAEDFRFRIGANVRFQGGFATPDGVVDLFGGRAVGWIEGTLFRDLNGNLVLDPDEPVTPGAVISAGGVSTTVDAEGRFRLALPAGDHLLTVGNLSAELALDSPAPVTVTVNRVQAVTLPLRTVTGLTGLVFADENRDGDAAGANPLPYVRVILDRADGQQATARADDRGRFHFEGLEPGRYTVSLDAGSLPEFHEATTPPVELLLEPGPFPRVTLGAAAQEKTVIQTFVPGDLTLTASVEPGTAPPGADVRVSADTRGEPQEVFVRVAGSEIPLAQTGSGRYEAMVTLPAAPGVTNLEVVARDGKREVKRSVMLLLQPGDLARLQVQPPYLEPADEARISAEFLTRVSEAFVLMDGERRDLVADGPYTFTGTFTAPAEPGSFELELWADGQKFAVARFRVAE